MLDFQRLFAAVPDLYLVLALDFVIVEGSDAHFQATNTKREAVIGRNVFDVFPENFNHLNAKAAQNLRASLESVVQNRQPHTMDVLKYDIRRPESEGGRSEERYWKVVNSPVFDETGELTHILNRSEDVTEFVQMQQQRSQFQQEAVAAKQQVETILSSIRDGFYAFDRDGRFTSAEFDTQIASIALERDRSNLALRESEERLRRALAIEMVGVIFFKADGSITDANATFLQMIGYNQEDVEQGRVRWDVMTPPEWMPASLCAIREFESTGHTTPYEKEYIRKDGSRWWGLFTAERINETEGVEFIIDISDRKQTEIALRQSEARLRLMIESAKEYAIFTLDFNGIVTSWNAGAKRLLGYAEAGILGRDGRIIFTPEDAARGAAERERQTALTQGQAENERWHVRQDGSRFWGSGLVMPLQDETGVAQGLIKILQDKTIQRQIEAEREQLLKRERAAREEAERVNRLKDEFLAVLSHELRSPLNPILGWSKLLQDRKFDQARTADALATIERNAKLQVQLIDDLLDVSRILQGKLSLNATPVNLATIITAALETVRVAASTKLIQIQTVLEPEVGQILGDSGRLQQVIWNLLSNAVKFTPQRGRIEIRLEQVEAQAQITVSDTGKGIAPHFLPHVFEYFQQADSTTTRQFGGLGLGLAIVRQIVSYTVALFMQPARVKGRELPFW